MTLRNRLHVQGAPTAAPAPALKGAGAVAASAAQPVVPPRSAPAPVPVVTAPGPQLVVGADLDDLIHLQGPLTEDAVMKCLQARFNASNFYVSAITVLDNFG